MKKLAFLILLSSLLWLGCEDGVPLGDKNIATYEWLSVYFQWDKNTSSVEAWNRANEPLDVRVRQKRGEYWYDVFNVCLRRRSESGHHHTEENVDFDEGDKFELQVRKKDWPNPEKVWIKLYRDSSGNLQVAPVAPSDSE